LLHYLAKNICSKIAPIKAKQQQTKRARTKENAIMVDELVGLRPATHLSFNAPCCTSYWHVDHFSI